MPRSRADGTHPSPPVSGRQQAPESCSPLAFLFSWRIFDNPVSPSECKIAFDVVDSPGAVIGEERLPFELKTNGVFWEFDSL